MASPDDDHATYDTPKPFVQHLVELRSALVGIVASLAVGLLIAFPCAPAIVRALKIPLRRAGQDPDQFLRVIDVTGGLSIAMQVILWSGVIFSMPAIVFFILRFIFPGLKAREKRALRGALGFAALLFAVGVSVGYFMLLPVTLQWMFGISAWIGAKVDFIQLNSYMVFVLKLLLGFGLAFEFPVVVVTLGSLGIASARFLGEKRRHVVVILLVISAIVTPTVDPVTQIFLAAPLYLLYEICIWIVWWMERRRRHSSAEGKGET